MIQHCISSLSSPECSIPSSGPLNMVLNYVNSLSSEKITDSLKNDLQFMITECRSTMLSTLSTTDRPCVSIGPTQFENPSAFVSTAILSSKGATSIEDDTTFGDVGDEGGCAVSCQSSPSWHLHKVASSSTNVQSSSGNSHSDKGSSNIEDDTTFGDVGDEGGCAVSCQSSPSWHLRKVASASNVQSLSMFSFDRKCVEEKEKFASPSGIAAKTHPVSSIVVEHPSIVSPSSDSSLLSPTNKSVHSSSTISTDTSDPSPSVSSPAVPGAKRNSRCTTSNRKSKKNKKNQPMTQQHSFLSLEEFFEFMDMNDPTKGTHNASSHPFLVTISPWNDDKPTPVQSTLCTSQSQSGSSSVLSTSSVSCSPMSCNTYIDSSHFSICAIERNEDAQMYRMFGLGKCEHFTCDQQQLHGLRSITPCKPSNITQSKPGDGSSSSRNFVLVPNSVHQFHDKNITVLNSVPSCKDKALMKAKSILGKIFNESYPHFSISASKSRNLPSISLGWTTTDCHAYKHNRTNIVGQIKPFLIKVGCKNVSKQAKLRIAKLSCLVISKMSELCGHDLFTYPSNIKFSKALSDLRSSFAIEYATSLGLTSNATQDIIDHFRCDGNSMVINPYVHRHRDSNNDTVDHWDNTLSINGRFPITKQMWSCPSFKKILNKLGYHQGEQTLVSVSLMIYSRKCIGDYCRSVIETKNACKLLRDRGNPIIDPIMKGLQDVGAKTNYRSMFDDDNAFDILTNDARRLSDTVRVTKRDPRTKKILSQKSYPPQYSGLFAEVVAAYDKLVSDPKYINIFVWN